MADSQKLISTAPGNQDTGGGSSSQQSRGSEATADRTPSAADVDRARRSTGTTQAQAEELAALGVNPALDNRTGDQRPRAVAAPQQVDGPEITITGGPVGERNTGLKPQQIPGPEVGCFAEHDETTRREHPEWFPEQPHEALGMRSEGPHGRGLQDG